MKTEAPHYSYPKRDGYFADTKRMGRATEAPMAIDVPHVVLHKARWIGAAPCDCPDCALPFDWATDQGDLAPIVRKVERGLFIAALVMAGWFAGCLMALYVIKGGW